MSSQLTMRIAVNLRLFVRGKIGGIENYVRQMMAGIAERQSRLDHKWTVFAHDSERSNVEELCPGATIIPVLHETSEQIIQEELRRTPYDLLFCPLLVLDPLRPGIPSAVTIPDLQHEFHPEFFDPNTLQWRRDTFRPSVFQSDVIFTISEFSKKTIVETFEVDPGKIVVVNLAADEEFRVPAPPEAQATFRELRLFDEYIYYPANYWPHKNHSALLRALQLLAQDGHPELGLVLTGATQGVERVQRDIAALGLEKNVRILSYQERAVIAEIYRHARALVFVSLFEGFGIPLLEAFHTCTPVVSSSACSLPEVAGDAAIFVDETSPKSIAAGVRRILDDQPLRNALIGKGTERVRGYSWPRAVDLTLDWLDRITQEASARQVQVREYPQISIVTPSFNMGRFLEETIQSVLSQDYPNIEYIVMDGGSGDNTLEILRKYEGKLRYQSQPDRGQAHAINRGFAESSGQIFAFLNADDTYLPGAVGTAVQHLLANRDAGAIYGEAYYVREDGSIIGSYPTHSFDYELLNRNCFICQPAAFMWRNAFAASGAMNEDLHYAPDYDLWIRMGRLYPFVKVDDYLATSRMHAANKTLGSRRQVYMEIVGLAKAHFGYVPFDWVFGYASFLLSRNDEFFEPNRNSHPKSLSTHAKALLSLILGCYYNGPQMGRYGKEWATRLGIGADFTGRWGDGWISKRYISELPVPGDCESITLRGKHLAPQPAGLTLTIRLNGKPIQEMRIQQHGPFAIETKCPPEARGKNSIIEVESSRTFRPSAGGDYRKLSCVIDSLTFE